MALHAELARDAGEMLARWHYPSAHIISVDRDSILFVSERGRAYTAWLDGSQVSTVQAGFIAEAPVALHAARAVSETPA